jgi:RNA polymerase sigma-70 factor (ECF subfamily)
MPRTGVPAVVGMNPPNGTTGVSPYTNQLVVIFSEPMGGGFSWTGGGPNFPETTGKPYWLADQKTCVLPVRLQPNWSYRVGLNSPSHKNFRSASGTPLQQVVWQFSTGG